MNRLIAPRVAFVVIVASSVSPVRSAGKVMSLQVTAKWMNVENEEAGRRIDALNAEIELAVSYS